MERREGRGPGSVFGHKSTYILNGRRQLRPMAGLMAD